MPLLPATLLLALVDLIGFPSDAGANVRGASLAPAALRAQGIARRLSPVKDIDVAASDPGVALNTVYAECLASHCRGHTPLVLGGDHSVAIGSVAASREYCAQTNRRLGVVWLDAHADFNTEATSPTRNVHGMCLAVLCGDALPRWQFGRRTLSPRDVLQYGVRDVDALEFLRVQEAPLAQADSGEHVLEWIAQYDAIHVSFDMDVVDPADAPGVSTPVPGGVSADACRRLCAALAASRKVIGVDVVELNPLRDVRNRTARLAVDIAANLLAN